MQYDPPPSRLPEEIKLALASFLFGLELRNKSVSIRAGVGEVRAAVPKCKLSDEALGTVVAQYAIENGFHVNLDGDGRIVSRN